MKKVHIKSAIPIYIAAAVWLVMGLLFPKLLMKIPGFLITAALSAAAGFASVKLFPGRDIEVKDAIKTGDAALDEEIAKGRERLENLKKANEAIPHPEITKNLDRMYTAGEQIFKELGRDPKKLALVRRFMNYYLPTSEKLMEQYQILQAASTKGENITTAMGRIESSTGLVADAFEKCVDKLYADDEMDIDAEIQVMKTMLTGDNLVKNATGVNIREVAPKNTVGSQPVEPAAQPAVQEEPAAPETTVQESELPPTKDGIKLTLGGH